MVSGTRSSIFILFSFKRYMIRVEVECVISCFLGQINALASNYFSQNLFMSNISINFAVK